MTKIQKIKIFSLLFFAVFLVSTGASQAALAVTDPNGNIIIDEPDISLSPERIKEKEDEQHKDNLVKVAMIIVVIVAVGSVFYFNKSTLLKQNNHSRKK